LEKDLGDVKNIPFFYKSFRRFEPFPQAYVIPLNSLKIGGINYESTFGRYKSD
jgi:hypothetical protein